METVNNMEMLIQIFRVGCSKILLGCVLSPSFYNSWKQILLVQIHLDINDMIDFCQEAWKLKEQI